MKCSKILKQQGDQHGRYYLSRRMLLLFIALSQYLYCQDVYIIGKEGKGKYLDLKLLLIHYFD